MTFNFKCDECFESSKTKDESMTHNKQCAINKIFKMIRRKPQSYSCDKCGSSINSKRDLMMHVAKVHKASLNCEFCDKRFKSKLTLNRHMKSKHEDLIDEDFKQERKMKLKKEVKAKKSEKSLRSSRNQFQCLHCSKNLLFKGEFIKHNIRYHIDKVLETLNS